MKQVPKLHLLFLFSFFTAVSSAQKQSKLFVEAAAGLAVPTGNFANMVWNENTPLSNAAGLAKTGFDISIAGGWQAKKNFSVMFAGGYSSHKQDAASFHNYLFNKYGNTTQAAIVTESWKVFKMMAGPSFNTVLSKDGRFIFRAKILAGASKTSIPGYKYQYSFIDPISNLEHTGMANYTKLPLPWFFCWQASAGVKYKASKNFYLFSEAGYFNASKNFHYKFFNPQTGGIFPDAKKINQSYISWYGGAGVEL